MSLSIRRIPRAIPLALAIAGTFAFPLAMQAGAAVGTSVRTAGGPLRVRSAPSTAAPQIGVLGNGARVSLVCRSTGDYVHGTVRSTTQWDWLASGGYVSHAYIFGGTLPACNTQASTAVRFALAQLGEPYVFGATGPNSWDCSGLVQAAWASAGVTIPRTTYQQVKAGSAVADPATLRPGDLVFTAGSSGTVANPGHVGMFIGAGGDGNLYIIQAPQTGDVVKLTLASTWTSKIAAIRRFVG
jgi:cell wall-associated NlpC family hydrolase